MKTLRYALLLGSIGWAPGVLAQEAPKPEAEIKPKEGKVDEPRIKVEIVQEKASDAPETNKRNGYEQAQKLIQAAQQAAARADIEAKAARAKLQAAQAEARQTLEKTIRSPQEKQFYYGYHLPRAKVGDDKAPSGKPTVRKFTVTRQATASQFSDFLQTFGLDFAPADTSEQGILGLPAEQGLVILKVNEGSPADKAGIKRWDVITKLDQTAVHDVPAARKLIEDRSKPSAVINLIRAGKQVEVTLTKPEPPASKEPFYLGIVLNPVDATLRSQLPQLPENAGLVVSEVTPNSPAAKAEAQPFDIVIKLDDNAIKSNDSLIEQVQKTKGEPIKVTILRKGETKTLTITPERRPAGSGRVSETGLIREDVTELLGNQSGNNIRYYFPTLEGLQGTANLPLLNRPSLDAEIKDQLEKELKGLNKQMADLQKAIDAMNKNIKQDAGGDKAKAKE